MKTVTPFDNTMDLVDLKDKDLWEVIELNFKTLQVSGLKIVVNLTKSEGEQLQSVHILCNEWCSRLSASSKRKYLSVYYQYLVAGGDGFSLLSERAFNHM